MLPEPVKTPRICSVPPLLTSQQCRFGHYYLCSGLRVRAPSMARMPARCDPRPPSNACPRIACADCSNLPTSSGVDESLLPHIFLRTATHYTAILTVCLHKRTRAWPTQWRPSSAPADDANRTPPSGRPTLLPKVMAQGITHRRAAAAAACTLLLLLLLLCWPAPARAGRALLVPEDERTDDEIRAVEVMRHPRRPAGSGRDDTSNISSAPHKHPPSKPALHSRAPPHPLSERAGGCARSRDPPVRQAQQRHQPARQAYVPEGPPFSRPGRRLLQRRVRPLVLKGCGKRAR
jgi:hypothetical protein